MKQYDDKFASILVGALQSNFESLTIDEHDYLKNKFIDANLKNYYHQFRSVLIKREAGLHSLVRVGEYVIVSVNATQKLAKISKCIAIPIVPVKHFVICEIFKFINADQYSGHKFVSFTSSQKVLLEAKYVLRKVILIPTPTVQQEFLVVDCDRPVLPLTYEDIDVPVYPEAGDFVKIIVGDASEWYAHIEKVNQNLRNVIVLYYERKENYLIKYKHPRDTVDWDCIKEVCDGHWCNESKRFYLK